jgi:opacity protein-like surface antigen
MSVVNRQGVSLVGCAVVSVLFQLPFAATAGAQARPTPPRPARPARPTPHAGSWEVSGGLQWQGGFDLGAANAELTRNPTTGTGPFDLFSSGTKLGAGIGFQGRVAGYVSKNLAIEGGLRLTRPVLTVKLSADFESAPDLAADETLTQYVIEGSAVWHFPAFHHGRAVPFVAGGAGYIRDLHEGNELIETGTEYHGVGGLKWWFSNHPRRLGLRAEAGFSLRDGGFDFRDGTRTVPIASVGLAYLF